MKQLIYEKYTQKGEDRALRASLAHSRTLGVIRNPEYYIMHSNRKKRRRVRGKIKEFFIHCHQDISWSSK